VCGADFDPPGAAWRNGSAGSGAKRSAGCSSVVKVPGGDGHGTAHWGDDVFVLHGGAKRPGDDVA
jgi:hypothetical protein